MSSYDIALVVDAGTLNQGMTQLYAIPAAQTALFQGTDQVNTAGITDVVWAIGAAPEFVLTPPTSAQWTNPDTFSPSGPLPASPTDQMFQVQLSSFTATVNMQQAPSVALNFTLTIFAQVGLSGQQVVLSNVAMLPVSPTPEQQIILQIAAGIAYAKVQSILQGYSLPSSIDVEGQSFTDPVMTVGNGYLIVASNLVASGTPSITGVTWPQQPFGILASRNLLSSVLSSYCGAIQQKLDSEAVNYSDSNWSGSYALSGGITDASVSLASTLPTVNVTATLNATASVGVSWWLVPAACALSAASNLL